LASPTVDSKTARTNAGKWFLTFVILVKRFDLHSKNGAKVIEKNREDTEKSLFYTSFFRVGIGVAAPIFVSLSNLISVSLNNESMFRDPSYDVWIAVTLTHTYFDTKSCNLSLEPSQETVRALKKAGILFQQYDTCTWVLLKPVNEERIRAEMFFEDEACTLRFELKNRVPEFCYYTQKEVATPEGSHWKYTYVGEGDIFSLLEIPASKELLAKTETIQLAFESQEKFWEYLLIPTATPEKVKVKMMEYKNQLSFIFAGMANVPGEQRPALRFITDKEVKLKEAYDFKISLWKITDRGEQLLSDNIRHPQPHSASLFDNENSITGYYYF
jgi:hypothetical protein